MLSEKRLESCAHGVARRVYEEGRPLATGQILDPFHSGEEVEDHIAVRESRI
jgi:hypothetical protein